MDHRFDNANEAFEYFFEQIREFGCRNGNTLALYNVGFFLEQPLKRTITCCWRKWSNRYADREWEWYLSQNRSVEELAKHAPIWNHMHGGDFIVNSNYGYQWNRKNQLAACISLLKENPYTRRAWISLYDGKEISEYEYDTPCTIGVGFHVDPRQPEYLNMTVIMRSNDLVRGFCNDQYCFSKLQEMVAHELNMLVGNYYHFAQNLHVYLSDIDMKERWIKSEQH